MSTAKGYKPPQIARDKKGRPVYLARLPIWKRYPRLFIVGGGCLVGFLPFAKQFYQALFLQPEDIPYQADWWPGEIRQGKRYIDQFREKHQAEKNMKEEYARQKAAAAEAAAAKAAAIEAAKIAVAETTKLVIKEKEAAKAAAAAAAAKK